MMIISEILKWAKENLKPWQRDALRRLFQKHDLNDDDFNDLYAMLRSAHGLLDPQNREPLPLSDEHVPAATSASAPVILKAMRGLRNVNRIASGQTIEFGPGLTVVYGPNASGKSGYSRVLKKACRARDNSEIVLPDATDAGGGTKEPEAFFDLQIGDENKSVHWKHESDAPSELSSVAVFDSHCARAFLDEGEAAFLPYGLDILENLAQRVFPKISQLLEKEISAIDVDSTPFQNFPAGTRISKIAAELSGRTDIAQLKELATMGETEQKRLGELEPVVNEIDPAKKAQGLRLSGQRLTSLANRITADSGMANDSAIENFKLLDEETEAAISAEKVAAQSLSDGPKLLPGTGGDVWRLLFEAARQFSEQSAYPGHPFPHIGTGAQCPLCQQVLDAASEVRLRHFDEFVKQETAKRADGQRAKRKQKVQQIRAASLDFGYDKAISDEIEGVDPALHKMVVDFKTGLADRKKWILGASESHVWHSMMVRCSGPVLMNCALNSTSNQP